MALKLITLTLLAVARATLIGDEQRPDQYGNVVIKLTDEWLIS
jgi:hypothetical protein